MSLRETRLDPRASPGVRRATPAVESGPPSRRRAGLHSNGELHRIPARGHETLVCIHGLWFDGCVFRWIALIAVVLLAVFVGVWTAWQWGVLVLVAVGLPFAFAYLTGTELDATKRWGRAAAGSDPDDEGHWSRR